MFEKVAKQEAPFIRNGIPFAYFAFLAHPALAYWKFNTRIFNKWSTQRGRTTVYFKRPEYAIDHDNCDSSKHGFFLCSRGTCV